MNVSEPSIVSACDAWVPERARECRWVQIEIPEKTVHSWILRLMASGVDATSGHTLMSESSTLMLCQIDKPAPAACYQKQEAIKKRAYEQTVREVEHSSFTPLMLSTTGGLAAEATSFYRRLAARLADKWEQPYSKTMAWLRCRLTFLTSLLGDSMVRGARSSCGHVPISSPPVGGPGNIWAPVELIIIANLFIFTVYVFVYFYIYFSSLYTAHTVLIVIIFCHRNKSMYVRTHIHCENRSLIQKASC